MTDVVAVDFETANERRGSPCAVGYAKVEGLNVEGSGAFLIRPPEFRFEGFNVLLNGITPAMCEDALPWSDALNRLAEIIGDSLVIAHYTPFDIGVIRDSCADTGTVCPELRFACTRQLARLVWPGMASYCLPDVAANADVELTAHHDAESDAVAAAQIAIASAKLRSCSSVPEVLDQLGLYPGTLRGGIYTRSTMPETHRLPRIPTEGVTFDPEHPFYGRVVVFTGGMMSMTRHTAQQAVVDVGGRAMGVPGKKTDFVVEGGEFHGLLAGHAYSQKMERAFELLAERQELELLNESEFLTLLRGGT